MSEEIKKPIDYRADSRAVIKATNGGFAAASIYLLVAVMFSAILWAYFAEIDEVTSGEGKIVPSSHVQIVQNLEGGIIKNIQVKEGQLVKSGQILLELEDTRFSSQFKERQAKRAVLLVEIVRLNAEAKGLKSIEFPPDLEQRYPQEVSQAREHFLMNKKALDDGLKVLERSYRLAKQELDIVAPLVRQGVMSDVDLIRLQRQVNTVSGQILEKHDKARTGAKEQLNKMRAELSVINEQMAGTQDQINRTIIRSPVDGVVNRLLVSSIGEVVQPGEDLVEIVPKDEQLTVQVYVTPKDIGFIYVGQKAIVRISAYDFSIYGGLDATVLKIGADSITDERGNSFYEVDLKTEKSYLGTEAKPLIIKPGMMASVSIMTGKKSILDYILKPFFKAQQTAMRER